MYPYYRDDTQISHEDERFFPFLPFLGGVALGGLLAGPRPYYGYGPQYIPAPYPVPYPITYPSPYPPAYPSAYPAEITVNTINQRMDSLPHQFGIDINDQMNNFPIQQI